MADTKITALAAITTVDPAADVLPIVDISDTSMAASGTTKKITSNQILGAGGTATLASATITGDLTVRTNKLAVTSSGVGLGTTSPNSSFQATLSGLYGLQIRSADTNFSNINIGCDPASGYVFMDSSKSGSGSYLPIRFSTSDLERMRLDTSGNLGLGVTPSAWGSIYRAFQIGGFSSLVGITNNTETHISTNAIFNGTNWLYMATSPASRYNQNDNIHRWFNAPSGTANTTTITSGVSYTIITSGNQTAFGAPNNNVGTVFTATITGTLSSGTVTQNITFTQALTLNANGALALQGGNTSANGVGIAFPATQVASTDANTLDDYEEGTWTPTIQGNTTPGAGTYVVQVGVYTKVGNQVTVWAQVEWSAHTGTGTQMYLSGLPFAVRVLSNYTVAATIGYFNNIALTAGNFPLIQAGNSDNFARFFQSPTGGGSASAVPMDTTGHVVISMTYQT